MDINIVEAAELTRNILIDWIPIFEDKQIDYNIDIPEQPFRVKLDTDGYILLYYFEGMTDVEIGKMFNTSRSTIQYRRTSSFELLKKYLEEHADEWNEW